MTTLRQMIDEIGLQYRERVDWANQLERAILMGHVKRNPTDEPLKAQACQAVSERCTICVISDPSSAITKCAETSDCRIRNQATEPA